MIFGGFLRFYRLGQPKAVVFDETYYVPDANSILHHGVELQHLGSVNKLLVAGNPNIFVRASTRLPALRTGFRASWASSWPTRRSGRS